MAIRTSYAEALTVWGMDRFGELVMLVIFHINSGGFIWKQERNV